MSAPISSRVAPPPAASSACATDLRIGGCAPLSSCDWPGELVATVFCQGCPWDCAYCHNAHLRPADAAVPQSWPAVLGFLRQRVGLLDGVVFSGGEPTLQPALGAAMRQARGLGFRIGLHTAGAYPDRLAALLPLVDWVGFDVKAPFDDYARVTGVPRSGERALASLALLLSSGVACEARTTFHPSLLGISALQALAHALADMGVTHYAVQAFQPAGCRNPALAAGGVAPPPVLPEALRARFVGLVVRDKARTQDVATKAPSL